MTKQPFIIGLGGTTTPGSSTEQALFLAMAEASARGARTQIFSGDALANLPYYGAAPAGEPAQALVEAVRRADGLILASPGYHGSISGLLKNAIDYFEETARDERPYLDGVPVGLIVTAYGWQATGSTLTTLRSVVHALRGWPTPFGAGINTAGGVFKDGACTDVGVAAQLKTVGRQVVEFANRPLAYVEADIA